MVILLIKPYSMITIYKYPLNITDEQVLKLPIGSKILCVQSLNNIPFLYAKVDTDAELKEVIINIYGTGNPIESDGNYIGTFQHEKEWGLLVFHVYEQY